MGNNKKTCSCRSWGQKK